VLQEETVLQQLHEKEMFWKPKLETNRVAATAQLRTETLKLEANHETLLRQRLLKRREQLMTGMYIQFVRSKALMSRGCKPSCDESLTNP
jgi:hypothetical protein